jgi:CRP/FNR family transcriptional regulator, cyclic AMP receptor protein
MKAQRNLPSDLTTLLTQVDGGERILHLRPKQSIFSQGDRANALFFLQSGEVELTVVSRQGREAVLGILDAGNFIGEECLAGRPFRMETATTLIESSLVRIDRKILIDVLKQQSAFSRFFISYLLSRNLRYKEDLEDQLFNSSEKRLARVLLMLAHFGENGQAEVTIPEVNQQMLAEKVGTTRQRVNFFMNKFRKMGFIEYGGRLQVHRSLFTVLHRD